MRNLLILFILAIVSCNKTVQVNCSNPNLILAAPTGDTTRYTIYSYIKGSNFGTLHDSTKVVLLANFIDYRYFILTDNKYDWIVKSDTGVIRNIKDITFYPRTEESKKGKEITCTNYYSYIINGTYKYNDKISSDLRYYLY